jgi:hypothetical protein
MALAGFNNSLKLTIDSSKVDEDLTNFPVNITLSSGTGIGGFDATAVFDELAYDWDGVEDFTGDDGDNPDSNLWTEIDSNSLLSIQSNALEFNSTSTGNHLAYINSKFLIEGDLDVQIDVNELAYTGPTSGDDGSYCIFRLKDSATSTYTYLYLWRWRLGATFVAFGTSTGWTSISRSVSETKFRFTRIGSVIKGYYWSGSQWEWNGNTAGITFSETFTSSVSILCYSGQEATNASQWRTTFDNFQINSGTVVWPEGTHPNHKKIAITDSNDNKLYTEIERWDYANEEANLWVNVPTIVSGTDTTLYLYYDATASGQDVRPIADVQDDFTGDNGSAPNSDLWVISVAGPNTITIDNNRLKHVSYSGNGSNGIWSVFRLSGDFDVQVDFDITGSPLGNYYGCGLQFYMKESSPDDLAQMYIDTNSSGRRYVANIRLSGSWSDFMAHAETSDVVGKVRMTRVANTFYGYYWNGASWTSHGSYNYGSAPDIRIKCYTDSWTDYPASTTYHDNFTINSADNITGWIGDTGETPAKQVWDSNFKGVWHMSQDPSGGADAILDSTSNTNHGTSAGSMTTGDLVDGKIGKAIDFDGGDDQFDITTITIGTNTTFSWVAQLNVGGAQQILSGSAYTDRISIDSSNLRMQFGSDGGLNMFIISHGATITDWHEYTLVRGSDIDVLELYVDGEFVGSDTNATGASIDVYNFGGKDFSTGWVYLYGILEEPRFSNIDRSPAWIKADYYSNWNDLVTFAPFGAITFIFSGPAPIPYSTVYGITHQLQLTTTLTGLDPSYIYDASFYDAYDDSQIGLTISGTQSGQYVTTTIPTPSGVDYNWYLTATASGQFDTSGTYTFTNRFMCSGHTQVAGTGASGIPVRLYRRSTGAYIGGAISSGVSGTFNIPTDYNENHYAVALYSTSGTNALIADWLKPSN